MDAHSRRAQFVADTTTEAIEAIAHGQSSTIVIARRLGEAVHAEVVSYGSLNLETGDCRLQTWPDIVDVALMTHATATVPHTHPVLHYWLTGHTGVAATSSLVTDRRAWRNSEAYALLRRGVGCTETGGIRLDRGNHMLRMIGFARHDDFTPDEMALIDLMSCPAIALNDHADWLANSGYRLSRPGRPDPPIQSAAALGLTTRELEVLELLADGLLASSMAGKLSISTRTVHRHLAHIYAKLNTHDRLTTVIRAQALSLLPAQSHREVMRAGKPRRSLDGEALIAYKGVRIDLSP